MSNSRGGAEGEPPRLSYVRGAASPVLPEGPLGPTHA
jgi:hypothetical protein